MLPRILEPEVMDTREEAIDYDAMDHGEVNRLFVHDFLQLWGGINPIVDLGAGTAQIPVELCRQAQQAKVIAVDRAKEMLSVGEKNVESANFGNRVQLLCCDAKELPFSTASIPAVMSNSIIHHIPEPERVIAEIVRITQSNAIIFVRDLLRPDTTTELNHIVETYAGDANDHQRKMFAESLHAALTVAEMQAMVERHGFSPDTVTQTSDRHWTWCAQKAS